MDLPTPVQKDSYNKVNKTTTTTTKKKKKKKKRKKKKKCMQIRV